MSIYENYVLPHVINCACGTKPILSQREKIVPKARGRVLEVGIGSGLNIPYYNRSEVEFVWGLEPSSAMRKKAAKRLNQSDVEVRWLDLPGEEIPLEDNSVDSILMTYTLCTIPDWSKALHQMHRVLKPSGKMLFCEHGIAPDETVAKTQNTINSFWKKICGGCNLNRPIPEYIEQAGFKIESMEKYYLPNMPKFAGFNYIGVAGKR
jgi:ubiquinone/menaquinone biosynthesis C-methylase UbiE